MLYWGLPWPCPAATLSGFGSSARSCSALATLLYAADVDVLHAQDAPEIPACSTYQYDGWKQTLLVDRVDPGSRQPAGLESGDLIVAVHGQRSPQPTQFLRHRHRGRPG